MIFSVVLILDGGGGDVTFEIFLSVAADNKGLPVVRSYNIESGLTESG